MENPNYFIPICLYQNEYGKDLITMCDVGDFYVINPEIRPIPTDLSLIYVNMNNTEIIDIGLVYDMFNRDNDYFKFLAWLKPVPNTVPLYIYKQDSIHLSFEKENYSQLSFSPIYVLLKPTLFTEYQGRCIPFTNGVPFEQCIVGNTKKPMSLSFISENKSNNIYLLFLFLFLIFYLKTFFYK